MFNYFVMRKTVMYLSSIKPRYFMLLVYLFLIAGATSCRDDHFESDLTDDSIQLSKAELIQQALSRMPQTRGDNPNAVVMVTIKNTVNFRCWALDSMVIHWGDASTTSMTQKIPNVNYSHTYTDGKPSHLIYISGSKQSIRNLLVGDNGLIFLDISYNENLMVLNCTNNHLDEVGWTGCSGLQYLYVANNELATIEVSHLIMLQGLDVKENRLTSLNVSKNQKLARLWIGKNQITDLDISENPNLFILEMENNPISSLDLTQHVDMATLNVSCTLIKKLDLRRNTKLQYLSLEGLSLETFNNHPVDDMSFSIYPQLKQLNVAYTPYTALDLFYNPLIQDINISGTEISRLDIADLSVKYLSASYSKLTSLIYTPNSLANLYELRIERTPFEKDESVLDFALVLPSRSEEEPGHLYSYSPYLDSLASCLKDMNWLINQ